MNRSLPATLIALGVFAALPAAAQSGSIPDVARAAGSFKTLLKAVEAAGLSETLASKGPFTVFAPTDAAVAALPAGARPTAASSCATPSIA